MSDQEFTKGSLLNRILTSRDELESVLDRIPEQDMQTPVLHDGWSVQDMLGHLAFWEESLVSRYTILCAGRQPDPITNIDALNAQTLSDFRRLSLGEVHRREREAYLQILAMIQDATNDELFKPGYFTGANNNPFVAWVPGETWEHYAEHLPELQAWLDGNARS